MRLIVNGDSEAEEADYPKDNRDDDEWEAELGLVDALVPLREFKVHLVVKRA